MENHVNRLLKFFIDEAGASSLEYTLLITFIAVVILASVSTLGLTVSRNVNAAANLFS
jgi:Flp pilus assembly pilin Flp